MPKDSRNSNQSSEYLIFPLVATLTTQSGWTFTDVYPCFTITKKLAMSTYTVDSLQIRLFHQTFYSYW